MASLFDPLRKIHSLCGSIYLCPRGDNGPFRITYGEGITSVRRERIWRIVRRYERLLLLQLDVPPGTKPRTVQQLLASGRLRVVDGRYVLPESEGRHVSEGMGT